MLLKKLIKSTRKGLTGPYPTTKSEYRDVHSILRDGEILGELLNEVVALGH